MPTRIVWITLLAAMDQDGFAALAAPGNVAGRARVTLDEAQTALETLMAPDPDSSDPANEGRRIERVPGGYVILNAGKYRDLFNREIQREQTRRRVAKYREVTASNAKVTAGNAAVTQSEAEATSTSSLHPTTKVHQAPLAPQDAGVPTALSDVEELKNVVGGMFKRTPGARWTQPEELLACEITRSHDWKKQWVELVAFRERTEYFPKSVHGLLDGWQKTLDRARNQPQNTPAQTTTAAVKTPGRVYALKTQIDAIEQRMAELKAHGTYEVSGGRVVWSDEAMKAEHRELRIKLDNLRRELIDT